MILRGARFMEAWEERHGPIDSPDPVEEIFFAMEHHGLSRRDTQALHRQPGACGRSAESQALADVAHDSAATRWPWDSRRGSNQRKRGRMKIK